MKLNEIKENKGARKSLMRVARGQGSGKGKTGGRGVKGQKSRSGVRLNGFEGGQTALFMTFAKRGFKNVKFKMRYSEVTLARLQKAIDAKKLDAKKVADDAALLAAGVITKVAKNGVKLLGTGELKSGITLKVAAATAGAIKAVEKAGGKVDIVIPVDLPTEDKAKGDKKDPKKAKREARLAKVKAPAKPKKAPKPMKEKKLKKFKK